MCGTLFAKVMVSSENRKWSTEMVRTSANVLLHLLHIVCATPRESIEDTTLRLSFQERTLHDKNDLCRHQFGVELR